MLGLAWREVRSHPRRLVAVLVAIVLSVAFLTGSVVFVATEVSSVGQRLTARSAGADVVADVTPEQLPGAAARLRRLPSVAAADTLLTGYANLTTRSGSGWLDLSTRPTQPGFGSAVLLAGRWPWTAAEITVASGTAKGFGVGIGETITVAPVASDPRPRVLRVVGTTADPRSLVADAEDAGVVSPLFFERAAGTTATGATLLLRATPAVSPDALAAAVVAQLPAETSVATAAARRREALDHVARGADVLRLLLLSFGGVALLVGGMLIANTYTVLHAGRRRTLALLRAVGARSGQIRLSLLLESSLVGLFGSIVGVAVGCAVAATAAVISGALDDGFVVPFGPVTLAGLSGWLATVLAAVGPALRTSRLRPVEALRPVPDGTTRRSAGRLRLVAVTVLILSGAGVVGWSLLGRSGSSPTLAGPPGQTMLTAVGGSLLLAVGVLASTPLYLPAVLAGLTRTTRGLGPTARLAGANLLRNPQRAAATCTALMLAVGLVVTMQVGAATMRQTAVAGIARDLPVDLTVTGSGRPLPPDLAATVAAVPGVRSSIALPSTQAELVGLRDEVTVDGLGNDAGQVLSSGLEALRPGSVLIRPALLTDLGLHDGARVRLRDRHHTLELTVRASRIPTSGTVVVSTADLRTLAPDAATGAVWAAAADRSDPTRLLADLRQATASSPGLEVGGSLPESVAYTGVLLKLLTVATALLAVAVLIALVGVGNTLSLSVLERSRESALLRALGLGRRQLARTIAVEGITLAAIGALVGAVAGLGFGVIGAAAAAQDLGLGTLQPAVSPVRTCGVVLVALLAGALASVRPGHRAAAAAPVTALAET